VSEDFIQDAVWSANLAEFWHRSCCHHYSAADCFINGLGYPLVWGIVALCFGAAALSPIMFLCIVLVLHFLLFSFFKT
jgi:uncharacterized membrane protein